MKIGDKYWLKVNDEWKIGTVTEDKSVNEQFWKTSSGEFIFQFEVEKSILHFTQGQTIKSL